jgi:ribokinase
MHLVVIGAYVVDCSVAVPRLPVWGEDHEARSIRTSPGGKALNQAVALARLGVHVSAIGVVGDDGLGRDVMSAQAREGIETKYFVRAENAATSICVCFVRSDGQTHFVWHIDEDVAVTPEMLRSAEPALREAADAVLITFETPVSTIQESVNLAQRCGAKVILQPAPPLTNLSAAGTLPWESVDVLVPNEAEARTILEGIGVKQEPQKRDLAEGLALELGVQLVVVTLGASGCVAYSGGTSRRFPAQQTVPVGTTGASDAFTATLAAYLAVVCWVKADGG